MVKAKFIVKGKSEEFYADLLALTPNEAFEKCLGLSIIGIKPFYGTSNQFRDAVEFNVSYKSKPIQTCKVLVRRGYRIVEFSF